MATNNSWMESPSLMTNNQSQKQIDYSEQPQTSCPTMFYHPMYPLQEEFGLKIVFPSSLVLFFDAGCYQTVYILFSIIICSPPKPSIVQRMVSSRLGQFVVIRCNRSDRSATLRKNTKPEPPAIPRYESSTTIMQSFIPKQNNPFKYFNNHIQPYSTMTAYLLLHRSILRRI